MAACFAANRRDLNNYFRPGFCPLENEKKEMGDSTPRASPGKTYPFVGWRFPLFPGGAADWRGGLLRPGRCLSKPGGPAFYLQPRGRGFHGPQPGGLDVKTHLPKFKLLGRFQAQKSLFFFVVTGETLELVFFGAPKEGFGPFGGKRERRNENPWTIFKGPMAFLWGERRERGKRGEKTGRPPPWKTWISWPGNNRGRGRGTKKTWDRNSFYLAGPGTSRPAKGGKSFHFEGGTCGDNSAFPIGRRQGGAPPVQSDLGGPR